MKHLGKWGAVVFIVALLWACILSLNVLGAQYQAAGTRKTLSSTAATPTYTPRPLEVPACVAYATSSSSGHLARGSLGVDLASVLPRTTQPVPSPTPPIATPAPRRAGKAIVPDNAHLLEPLVVIFPGVRLNDLVFRGSTEMITVGYVDKISQWDPHAGLETGRIVDTREEAVALSLAINPSQQLLATGGGAWDNRVRLWDIATGAMRELGRHQSIVVSVAFSPDGSQLASGDGDDNVLVWDVSSGAQVNAFEGDVAGWLQTFSNLYWVDNDTLAAAGSHAIYRWDLTTSALQERLARPSQAAFLVDVAFAQGGDLLAAVAQDDTMYVWERGSNDWSGWPAKPGGRLIEVTFSPDGQLLAAGTDEGDLLLWDVQAREQLLRCSGPADAVAAVRFSPDGRYVVAIGWDSTIWLWGIPVPAPELGPPPPVPEASTFLLMGAGIAGLATYVGMQLRLRRPRQDDER
jgi:hypothetical protein